MDAQVERTLQEKRDEKTLNEPAQIVRPHEGNTFATSFRHISSVLAIGCAVNRVLEISKLAQHTNKDVGDFLAIGVQRFFKPAFEVIRRVGGCMKTWKRELISSDVMA